METLIPYIIQLISGGVGGNIAGVANKFSLGSTGNSIAGAIGGLLGGQGMEHFMSSGAADSIMQGVTGQAVGSGVAGIVLTAIIGCIRNILAARK